MKKLNYLFFGAALWLGSSSIATAQCPNCTISLPAVVTAVVDTIHLDSFPNGQKNVYYEENLSFRLPHSTDPINAVDPGTPAGIAINTIEILSVSGLPAGMSYKVDRNPAIYNETSPTPRDGCVTMCGVPAQSGTFTVYIDVFVNVAVLGDVPYQFPLTFIVEPDSSAAFASSTNTGTDCTPTMVGFTNMITSNGAAGITYSWDFGNGQTSTLENPDSVAYTTAGSYGVVYQAIIDTFPFNLRRVIVTSTDCNDDVVFISTNAPDLYLIFKDALGTEIINNDPNVTPVIGTQPDQYPPDTVWTGQQVLDPTQTYTVEIWDDDNASLNADDACGVFTFTGNTTQTTFVNGAYAIEIWLEHFIDTVNYTDSIFITPCALGIPSLSQIEKSLNVYPNPTNGNINVTFYLPVVTDEAELHITDMLGRSLERKQLGNFSGSYNQDFNMSDYGVGVYLLQLRVGKEMIHRKIVVR